MLKEPPHIQAHLVFTDTQAKRKKPKEPIFLPTLDRNEIVTLIKNKRQ
jgi:hypothetical protein